MHPKAIQPDRFRLSRRQAGTHIAEGLVFVLLIATWAVGYVGLNPDQRGAAPRHARIIAMENVHG